MHIVFGRKLDSGAAPETVTGNKFDAGNAVLGPVGMLATLETWLALRGPSVPESVRIAQFMSKALTADDGNQYYTSSLACDPWATAQFLLKLRDELTLAGWDGQALVDCGRRANAISHVELAGRSLSPGHGDRLRQIVTVLGGRTKGLPLSLLTLTSSRDIYPIMWRKLFDQLERIGVIVDESLTQLSARSGDLLQIQSAMMRKIGSVELSGDGTFSILEADDEMQASEAVAHWLFMERDSEGLVIINGISRSPYLPPLSRIRRPKLQVQELDRLLCAMHHNAARKIA